MDNPWGEEPDWARSTTTNDDDDNDEDDDFYYNDPSTFAAQHILVLIDCNPTMFTPTLPHPSFSSSSSEEDEEEYMTPFDIALSACEKLLRLRVNYVATSRSGRSRDGVGVLLYGCQYKHQEEDEEDSETDDDEEVDISTNREQRGVLLSSTYELISLNPPGTEQVLNVMDCLPPKKRKQYSNSGGSSSGRRRKRNLEHEFISATNESGLCTLRSALHEAGKIFTNAKCVKKNSATVSSSSKSSPYYLHDSKTIWIFTNNDNPSSSSDVSFTQEDEEKSQVLTIAKDAIENGIDIKIWALPRLCHFDDGMNVGGEIAPFDWGLFYNDFAILPHDNHYHDDDEHEEESEGHQQESTTMTTNFDLEEMMEHIKIHWKKVRKAFSLPLLLPGWRNRYKGGEDEVGIMMDFFRVVNIQRRPQPVTVHQETNKMTVKTTQTIALETGELVPPERIQTYIEFGGEHIPLSRNEVSLIKKQSNANDIYASLNLIGFQPLRSLPSIHMAVDDKCYVVYPNEDMIEGSKRAFDCLYESMVRKSAFGVGELLTRVTGMSRLVAILPQTEGKGKEHQNASPTQPGFLVFQLPYEDDVRAVEENNHDGDVITADETTVEAAMDLIQKQRMEGIEFGYSFENPALKNFWNYIESVALDLPLSNDDDDSEEEYDQTAMDVDGILKCAGREIEGFQICLPDEDDEKGNDRKRKPRKRKILVVEEDDSGIDWVHAHDTNTLSDFKVDELKKYLRSVGAKTSGRKAELVERVQDFIEEDIKKIKKKHTEASSELSDSFGNRVRIKEEGEV